MTIVSAEPYLDDLATTLNLQFVRGVSPYRRADAKSKGAIIGMREKYILSLDLASTSHENTLVLVLRYPAISDSQSLRDALRSSTDLSKSGRRLTVSDEGLLIEWFYTIRKPDKSEVLSLLDTVLSIVTRFAPGFGGCEKCGHSQAAEIVLLKEKPLFHCSNCQQKLVSENEQRAIEYRSSPRKLKAACIASGIAGVICSVLGGMLLNYYSGDNEGVPFRAVIVVTVIISSVVGHFYTKRIGRISPWKDRIVSALIALGCIFLAELINATLLTMKDFETGFSVEVLVWSAKDLVKARFTPGLDLFMTILQVICTAIPSAMLRRAVPRFEDRYSRLSTAANKQVAAG